MTPVFRGHFIFMHVPLGHEWSSDIHVHFCVHWGPEGIELKNWKNIWWNKKLLYLCPVKSLKHFNHG